MAIELGRRIDLRLNDRVHALDGAIRDAVLPGVRETVPAYASVLVHYDPLVVGYRDLAAELERIVISGGPLADAPAVVGPQLRTPSSRSRRLRPAVMEIPVAYGGEDGPDLEEVARRAGITVAEVIRRHAAGEYRVAMIGFAPGFPYLMGMDPAIACPRLATPRVRVPAGSVGIADTQTGIYPYAMPGGWRLIGRTAVRLFDPVASPPTFLEPGQRVRFLPVPHVPEPPPGRRNDGGAPPGRPVLRVVEPGFLTSIQDAGRWGHQRYGVPPSGAADARALARGNALVGGPPNAAALEITAGGATFEVVAPCRIALSGATVHAALDGRALPWASPVDAAADSVLRLGRPDRGLRTYLCIAGGFDVPMVLGSRSTYLPGAFGGLEGRALRAGDQLGVGPASPDGDLPVPTEPDVEADRVAFVPGGQWDTFDAADQDAFLATHWRVSHRSDRIGLRLEGPPLPGSERGAPFVSDGTVTGAIQVGGDGLPIVLSVDRQTTGGYPKLGAVASVALTLLGQLAPGDEVRFVPITVDQAQEALRHVGS